MTSKDEIKNIALSKGKLRLAVTRNQTDSKNLWNEINDKGSV
jgi:hypothetical protein